MDRKLIKKAGFTDKETTYIKTAFTMISCGIYLYKNKGTGKNILNKCTGGSLNATKIKSLGNNRKND